MRVVGRQGRLYALLGLLAVLLVTSAFGILPTAASADPASTVTRGPRDRPRIALTFDDNYRPERARAILNTLRSYNVPATIFVVGVYIDAFPDLSRRIAEGGFEVGDHTLNHAQLSSKPWATLLREIGGGTDAFRRRTGGRTSPLFRPPYGATNSSVAAAAGLEGFRYQVLWDIDTNDWRGYSAATIRNHVLSNAHNGAIVLFHLSALNTAEALPGIITGLRNRGYELVTVSGLLKGGRRFIDVDESSEVGRAVLRLVKAGIMSGYNADWFGPADPLTRAQLAKVAVLTGGLHTFEVSNASKPTFADVPPQRDSNGSLVSYPFDFVEEAAAAGLIAGREQGGRKLFDPNNKVTRLQLAQVIARMARQLKGYPETLPEEGAPGVGPIPAFADVPEYGLADAVFVARLGLMRGFSDVRFDSYAYAQRGHVAVVMTRFLDLARWVPPTTTTTTSTSTTTTSTSSSTTSTTLGSTTTAPASPTVSSATTSTTIGEPAGTGLDGPPPATTTSTLASG